MGSVPVFATILAVVVIGFPLLMFLVQDRLLFMPQRLAESRREEIRKRYPAVEEIVLESENQKLHAWHVKAAPGKPLVIYFGGNAEEVSWMLEDAVQRAPGVGWLLVSYRGYGASEGSPSEASISADALTWHDYSVKNLGAREVVAFGRSLGSGAAVFLASERKLASVILVTPFDSLVEVAKHHYPFLPVSLLLRHRFDSVGRAPMIAAPLLCIAAGQDNVIPVVHARRLFDAWGGPKRWIEFPGADHDSISAEPGYWCAITAFLDELA
jgi:pimeloyl-ACP methyl ester carboxylesterase